MKPESVRSIDDLQSLVRKGIRPKYQFFWGHKPRYVGSIDQSCLSNWFPSPFEVDSITYPTLEHYMMAEKARLFGDEEIRTEILAAENPGKAKSLGRKVKGFNEETWTSNRFGIVVAGAVAKFTQNRELGEFLLRTGNKVLVEASPQDRIWGIGMNAQHEHANKPQKWNGLNLLGFALMEARQRMLTQD